MLSNGPDNFGSLGSNKEIQPKFTTGAKILCLQNFVLKLYSDMHVKCGWNKSKVMYCKSSI